MLRRRSGEGGAHSLVRLSEKVTAGEFVANPSKVIGFSYSSSRMKTLEKSHCLNRHIFELRVLG